MGKKEFAAAALDPKSEIFIVYITSLSSDVLPNISPLGLDVHPSQRPQISGVIVKKATTKISAKYSDFVDKFSLDLASKLSKYTKINDYAIELVDGQQSPYRPI